MGFGTDSWLGPARRWPAGGRAIGLVAEHVAWCCQCSVLGRVLPPALGPLTNQGLTAMPYGLSPTVTVGVTAMSNGSVPGGPRLTLPEMRLLWVSTVDTLPGPSTAAG
jgi:hypothetical protein